MSPWVHAIHPAGCYICKLFRLPEPQPGGSKPVITPLANSGEEHLVALLHFTTLTSSALAPRHNHVWYYCQTRDHLRRMCRLRNFASEFCWRRPPYKQDRSPAHHCNTGPQATYRCDDCYSEETMSEIPVVQLIPTFNELFPVDDSEGFEYLHQP